VALVARLETLGHDVAATPDEDFRAATRTRLVAMAAVRAPAAEASARRPPVRAGAVRRLLAGAPETPATRWRTRLTAGLAGAALTVTALGGLLGAAQGARPGDLLYDLKRGGEQTQLALASDSRRGVTLLDFASTRLDELEELLGGQPDADAAGRDVDLVLDTLQTMDQQTVEGTAALTSRAVEESDADALAVLSRWTAGQRSGLAGLVEAMPTGAAGALSAARDLVDQVAARGTALQTAFGCPGGPSTAGGDDLGPLPADCPAAPPTTAGAPAPGSTSGTGGSSVPGGTPTGTAAATGGPAAGTTGTTGATGAAPTTGAVPTTAASGASTGSSSPPTTVAPGTTARPNLPLPTLPTLPSVPGAPTSAGAPASSPRAIVSVPTIVPGVEVCLPPLITIGC
jgi:hypothetical protein